jgi:hypothetical protein
MMEEVKGVFVDALKRSNKQIKDARAEAIAEDLEITYKRRIEDLELDLKNAKRQQANMLDLSPDNTYSLKLATDFDAKRWTEDHINLGKRIHNVTIELEIAKRQYNMLFNPAAVVSKTLEQIKEVI